MIDLVWFYGISTSVSYSMPNTVFGDIYIYIYIYIYILPTPNIVILWFILLHCVCGLQYIGRTNQRLDSRIKHVPTEKKRQGNYFADRMINTYWYSIAEHLINNRNSAASNNSDLFTILSKSHSDYRLKVLETIHILCHKPSLCKQKECLLCLNLISI